MEELTKAALDAVQVAQFLGCMNALQPVFPSQPSSTSAFRLVKPERTALPLQMHDLSSLSRPGNLT
jgi:hypothetical protein